jgi:hypothetical protein
MPIVSSRQFSHANGIASRNADAVSIRAEGALTELNRKNEGIGKPVLTTKSFEAVRRVEHHFFCVSEADRRRRRSLTLRKILERPLRHLN